MRDIDRPSRGVWAVRHAAVVLALSAAVFLQEPGRTASDTKLDLTQNPWGLLSRALHLWEPLGFFGQTQNQAYGYLVPMGPFFGLLHTAHVPAWVTQRLWWSLLLGLAYVGMVLLTRGLVRAGHVAALAAGLAFVLAPRFMSVMGPVSAEVVPMALAPWILLPLVHHARLGTRRAAALSAVAVLACGGVNAAAVLAVLVLPVLYLLTRTPGPTQRRLAAAWSGCVILAILWWLVPLVVLGGVSPPFLDWIESASVTTANTSPATVLRGANHWVAYLAGLGGPEWRGGWSLVAEPAFVLDTMVVAGLGLAGLATPRCRERLFLLSAVVVGLVCVTLGHVGAVDGVGSEWLRTALDGSLAPFRNIHKFDPVLRVPLAIGVGLVVGRAAVVLRRGTQVRRILAAGVVGVTAVGLMGSAGPLLTGQFIQRGSFEEVPGYWSEAAVWLSANSEGARSLLVPGASFSDSYWGRTKDDPLQVSGSVVWATRDAVPLAPAGTIRFLDSVQRRLVTGTASPGLAVALARAGIRYVVVRNDLDYAVAGSPRPLLVHEVLDNSPGLRRVRTFGSPIGGGSTSTSLVDRRLDRAYPAVEIYAVEHPVDRSVLVPESAVTSVVGGPESLLDLLDEGVTVGPATELTSDPDAAILTDSPRRRDISMGRVDDGASATLAEGVPSRTDVPVPDYLSPDATPRLVSAVQDGATVTASSSVADAGVPGGSRPEHQPYAAVDGDPVTSWVSAPGRGAVGQWLELAWDGPLDPRGTRISIDQRLEGPAISALSVTTDAGTVQLTVPSPAPAVWQLPLPAGETTRLRVTVTAVADGSQGFAAGLAEVDVPGVEPSRPIRAGASGSTPTTVVLRAPLGWRAGCVLLDVDSLCSPNLPQPGEEDGGIDRLIGALPSTDDVVIQAVPNPSDALDAWVTQGAQVSVSATSSAVRDPSGAAYAVLDDDLGTGWVAGASDPNPTLTFTYDRKQTVRAVRVTLGPELAASRPGIVLVSSGSRVRQARLRADGVAVLPAPLTGSVFTVAFRAVSTVQSYDPFRLGFENVPVGASEIRLVGADAGTAMTPDDSVFHVRCGDGPSLSVNGTTVPVEGTTTVGSLRRLEPLTLRPCDAVPLSGVSTRLVVASVPGLRVESLVIGGERAGGQSASVPTTLVWEATHRELQLGDRDGATWLIVRENANPGWQATLNGETLPSRVADGWQQAWVVPEGAPGIVTLTFTPDTPYRWGLAAGGVAVLLLLALALLPVRRGRPTIHLEAVAVAWPWIGVLLILAALVAVGPWGLLAALVGWSVAGTGRRWTQWAPAAVSASCIGLAAGLLASGPWASFEPYRGNSAVVQLLVAAALGGAVAAGGTGRELLDVLGTRRRSR